MDQTLPPDEAAAALGLVSSSRAELADRLVTPWWYHPALGLLGAMLVLATALDSVVATLVAVALFGVGCGLLVDAYRRLTGVWLSGYAPGRARRWAFALAAVLAGSQLLAVVLRNVLDSPVPAVVLAVLVVPATVLVGRRYDRDLRAELRASAPRP